MKYTILKTLLICTAFFLFFACKKYDDVVKKSDYETNQGSVTVSYDGFTNDSIYLKASETYARYLTSDVSFNLYKIDNDTLVEVSFARYLDNPNGSGCALSFAFNKNTLIISDMIEASFQYCKYQNGNEFVNYSKGMNVLPSDTTNITNLSFDVATGKLTGSYTFKSRKDYITGNFPSFTYNYTYMTISGSFDVTLNKVYN